MIGLKEQLRVARRKLETALIQRALEEAKGNITHAAKALKISRVNLQKKMKAYGLRA